MFVKGIIGKPIRFLLPTFFLLLAAFGFADRVTMKNGSVFEGKIVYEDGAEIRLDARGLRQTLYKKDIQNIERVQDSEIGPGESSATAAVALLDANNSIEAWNELLKMIEVEEDAWKRHTALVQRAAMALSTAADKALEAGDSQRALEIAELLGAEKSAELVSRVYPERMADMEQKIRTVQGTAHLIMGRAARKVADLETAEKEMRQALLTLREGDQAFPHAQLTLGLTLRDKGFELLRQDKLEASKSTFLEAQVCLETARRSTAADAEMSRLVTEELANIKDNGFAVIDQRTIINAQTPIPTPTIVVPRPTPVPSPTPEPGMWGKILGQEKSAKFSNWLDGVLPESIDSNDAMNWGGYLLVFIIVFWVVPSIIFVVLKRRLDPIAEAWSRRVVFLGPLALLGYMVTFVRSRPQKIRIKKSKHPCPHCGYRLDDILGYTNLDFEHCPNCGGEVKPVHSIGEYIEFVANSLATDAEKVERGIVSMASFVEKDAMQKLVKALITQSIRSRASDLHVEPNQGELLIRYRIDGIMMDMNSLPASLTNPLVSAIKVMANLDIAEKRKPQDGSMRMEVDGSGIDIRVASSPSQTGETLTLRLLDSRTIQLETKHLGMSKTAREVFEKAIREPHGLILVTGPTGSGKTTTLYVALRTIATGDKHIISIEDPIEFRIQGINQIQVNPPAGLTFATSLRSVLRQDPDVIMVGEIRDRETAEISVNAAQTGHLVFSTLHTIDASSTVTRLFDLGVNPNQFAHALTLVAAQRLIRLVCPECKHKERPSRETLDLIGIGEMDEATYPFLKGKKCDFCNQTGFHGRTGIYEILAPNSQIRTVLERGNVSTAELRELAISAGMRTLREEALLLLKQGMTTADEVLRVTK